MANIFNSDKLNPASKAPSQSVQGLLHESKQWDAIASGPFAAVMDTAQRVQKTGPVNSH